MKQLWSLVAVAALVGCTSSHGEPDASDVDAFAGRDAGAADAFVVDAGVDAFVVDAGADAFVEHDAFVADAGVDAFVFDARVPRCGDGIVDEGEACDGSDAGAYCSDTCRRPCDGFACPDGQICVPIAPDIEGGMCVEPIPGDVGAACVADGECASGDCDLAQGRCVQACGRDDHDRCGGGLCGGTRQPLVEWDPATAHAGAGCWFPCAHDSDCPTASACTLIAGYSGTGRPRPYGRCLARSGAAELGAACDETIGCTSNACIAGACTRPCLDDADCVAPLSRCEDVDLSDRFGLGLGFFVARLCVAP